MDSVTLNIPFEYGVTPKQFIFDGVYRGIRILAYSCTTHPCGYIALKEGDPLYGLTDMQVYDVISSLDTHRVFPHGGFTYSRDTLAGEKDAWFLGWDYAHLFDARVYPAGSDAERLVGNTDGTYYTTDEIVAEAQRLIDYIVDHKPELLEAMKHVAENAG